MVDPKRDPGQHHDENAWQISLENEVSYVSLQFERQREPLIDAGGQFFLQKFEMKLAIWIPYKLFSPSYHSSRSLRW